MINWKEEKDYTIASVGGKPYAKIEDNGKKITVELFMVKFPLMNSKKMSVKYSNDTEKEMALTMAKNHVMIALDEYTMFINQEYKTLNSR
jgi:hypothetical protein